MDEAFHDDLYSSSFNILRLFGQWNLNTESKRKKKLYDAYRVLMLAFGSYITFCAYKALYDCRDNFRKAVFNLCTTTIITGITIKNFRLMILSPRLDVLRFSLFQDGQERTEPEVVEILEKFRYMWKYVRRVFYYAAYVLMPAWWINSLATLRWGPRELPFSIWLPLDLSSNTEFAIGFCLHVFGSLFIIIETIHADLGMFAIILQISSFYEILSRDIKQIGELYAGDLNSSKRMDINRVLLSHKTSQRLKDSVRRQLVLMGYVKELEYCYNMPMMIQLITGFVLSIGNGLELIVVSMNFGVKLSYQVGYSLIVLCDVYMVCQIASLLKTKREYIAASLYDLPWYFMDEGNQKDLVLMITGAQKNHPLTAGKMFKLNLKTYLRLIKGVYSWLALFRQLLLKK